MRYGWANFRLDRVWARRIGESGGIVQLGRRAVRWPEESRRIATLQAIDWWITFKRVADHTDRVRCVTMSFDLTNAGLLRISHWMLAAVQFLVCGCRACAKADRRCAAEGAKWLAAQISSRPKLVESGRGLHNGLSRLHELLRDEDGRAAAGYGHGKVRWSHAKIRRQVHRDGEVRLQLPAFIARLGGKNRGLFRHWMSDLFHDSGARPHDRSRLGRHGKSVLASVPVLTKRPERMAAFRRTVRPRCRSIWLGRTIKVPAAYLDR